MSVASALDASEMERWSQETWTFLEQNYVEPWKDQIFQASEQYFPYKCLTIKQLEETVSKGVFPLGSDQFVSLIDLICQVPPAPRDMTVYRGVQSVNLKPNDVLTHMTPFATTSNPFVAQGYAGESGTVLRIRVPAGFPSLYLGSSTAHMGCALRRLEYTQEQSEIRMQPTFLLVESVDGNVVDCVVRPLSLLLLKVGKFTRFATSHTMGAFLITEQSLQAGLDVAGEYAKFRIKENLEFLELDEQNPDDVKMISKIYASGQKITSFLLMNNGVYDRTQLIAAM